MRLALASLTVLALAGCGQGGAPVTPGVSADPMVTAVLNERILSDPDLAGMADTGAVLAIPGPFENLPPSFDRSEEEFRRAREAAVEAAGGVLAALPAPGGDGPALAARSPRDVATALPAARRCLAMARPDLAWSASLPAEFPIAPRGHVLSALGSDAPGCRLRAVRYVVALGADDLAGFYAARARGAGFTAARRKAGTDDVLEGASGAAAWLVLARKRNDGLAEVDLVTVG